MRRLLLVFLAVVGLSVCAHAQAGLVMLGAGGPSASACGAFSHCYSLTYTAASCGSSTSSGFPFLVYFSSANLKDAGHGGYVNSSAGADILFYTTSGFSTQIPSELDFYDNVNGIGDFWVQGTCSSSANGTIYMAVGNSSPPSRTTNPWDANYMGVWHLGNGSSLATTDSTSNHNNATANTSLAGAGKIDGGIQNNSPTQYTTLPSGMISGSGNRTVSAWVETSVGSAHPIFDTPSSYGGTRWAVYQEPTNAYVFLEMYGGTTYTTTSINDGNWHKIDTVSTNGTVGGTHIYIDGVDRTTSYNVPTQSLAGWGGAYIANFSDNLGVNYDWPGGIDDLRVSNSNRSADWIKAEYNNQSAPGNIGSPGFWTWTQIQ